MSQSEQTFDAVIVGGGIVGASIAYHLAPTHSVLLLEAESAHGYHSTGRSAAQYAPSYGPPGIRALTRASADFFTAPPAVFGSEPLLQPRGALFFAGAHQLEELQAFMAQEKKSSADVQWLNSSQACAQVPVLRPDAVAAAVLDPRADDIDVELLLQGFLRGALSQGAQIVRDARVSHIETFSGGWQLHTEGGKSYAATNLVNAAGAWVDQVAALAGVPAVGIEPRRRSAFLFEAPVGLDTAAWPLTLCIDESFYFKPEAGLLLGSPANADLVEPHDVVAEDLEIAIAVDRIETCTTMRIDRIQNPWAGLRSFVADGEPALGFDAGHPGFFWAAGLGGYGIQSAPAMGRLCAALIAGQGVPEDMAAQGLSSSQIDPNRAALRS